MALVLTLVPGLSGGPGFEGRAAMARSRHSAVSARQYIDFALRSCNRVSSNMAVITRVAEIVARRHLAGGTIGAYAHGQGLANELSGRSGGMMIFGTGSRWEKSRTAAEEANNVLFVGWMQQPLAGDLTLLAKLKAEGTYLIGFGAGTQPAAGEHGNLYNAWFDTGTGTDDRVVELPDGRRAGHAALLVNMLYAWTLEAEVVSALTRLGVMPPMYQSIMVAAGPDWNKRYWGKDRFHTDLKIAPVPRAKLGMAFLHEIESNIKRFRAEQIGAVEKAASSIAAEVARGRKVTVAYNGHADYAYVGRTEDSRWAFGIELIPQSEPSRQAYLQTSDRALVLRVGYTGLSHDETSLFRAKQQRVILLTTQNPYPDWQAAEDGVIIHIDMGWAFGDAAVAIPGYPIHVFAPSGIMQLVAYESIDVEVLARIKA